MELATKTGLPIWHLWRDQEGISHLTCKRLEDFSLVSFIQGMPQVWRSAEHQSASKILFLHLEPGQTFGWHENPVPQWIVAISGRFSFETMDGTKVEFSPGDLAFGADQHCRCIEGRQGHQTETIGSEPAVLMLIQVDSDPLA